MYKMQITHVNDSSYSIWLKHYNEVEVSERKDSPTTETVILIFVSINHLKKKAFANVDANKTQSN